MPLHVLYPFETRFLKNFKLYEGEGNGNPLRHSCLENPRDGRAWWAATYGVAQSRTRLKWLSSSSSKLYELFIYFVGVCAQLLQSCLTLCDPMNCNPPGLSVHGISQAKFLEWVAISSSRASSWPRDWTQVSCVSCIASGFVTAESLGKPIFWLLTLC